jgi:D-amino-acid dehydrogenase
MKYDVIVLGAGMVGISTAIHLQQRGRKVALVDRRGPAEETSYGNTGIIQTEAVVPYVFPRDIKKLALYAMNRMPESNLHWSALPSIAPQLLRYWLQNTPEKVAAVAKAWKPLAERCYSEHRALLTASGVENLTRATGYLKVFRSQAALDDGIKTETVNRERYGVKFEALDLAKVKALEPHLEGALVGGLIYPDAVSVSDPGKVGKAYADHFVKLGGTLVTGDARTLEATAGGWQVGNVDGPVTARDVVIALGPWSGDLLAMHGIRLPTFVKRGYHMHFRARGNATLSRPVIDAAGGYVITPMTKGIRLTTGAEFADRDARHTPAQLGRCEPMARDLFPLADRVDPQAWLGRRPCLPDMLPVIGPVPGRAGLWANFGHQHWGFTMGPATGRLLAEMMTREATLTDPFPYRAERFSGARAAA